jgi:hypothetical protein
MEACYLDKTQEKSHEWRANPGFRESWRVKDVNRVLAEMWDYSAVAVEESAEPLSVEYKFLQLANEWEKDTAYVSSVTDLKTHPLYKKIIDLGWDVVPFLLKDLEVNKRFWFPALAAITKIRPFDPSDAGNGAVMMQAWLTWGKRKGLI